MSRREFLRLPFGASAGIGLGWLATTCSSFAPGGEAGPPGRSAKARQPVPAPQPGTVAAGAFSAPVQEPAREALPGVFASMSLETVYYIRCGERAVLIDTGFVRSFPLHLANFEKSGLDLSVIDAVLVSHFHVDHAAALADARKRLKCPVVAHKNNVAVIESGDRIATAAYMPYLGWDLPFQACPVDHPVEDGDTVTVGATTFTVVHLPGHTPGCTGYLFGDRWLVIGDVVFPSGILGWNDVHWGSNYLDIIDTMRRIAEVNPAKCIPSHGLPWPYDKSTSEGGEKRARGLLEPFSSIGPIACTFRAPLAEKDRTLRHLVLTRGGARSKRSRG